MTTIVAAGPRVPSPRWPVPEERRTVSVLFVDIVGSTALVDRLDPEDVRAVQRAYFDTVARVLRRWHGVVEKYIGDAVMALFGARESDGFDAYRAVRAGLEIQRALDGRPLVDGIALRVRVGVATGEAVVDLAAARSGGHGAASGAVITTAARLQEYAPPGGVALCAATHRATAGLVAQRRLTPVTPPGRVPPVGVWHAVGPATPPAPSHDAPLVGRRRELATARDQILRAVRDRSPRWVSVVGAPGSGRSRLLHELTSTVRTVDGVTVRWCVASCPPYPDEPLAPVAALLRGLTGGGGGIGGTAADRPSGTGEGLAAVLSGLFAPARLAEALPALDRLLTAPDGSAAAAEGAAWCREVLLRLAAVEPVVVAVDDLDRAAPAVHRFLHTLFTAAAARELPLAVVALHRPDSAETLPAGAERWCPVAVRPLPPVQTGRLLRHLLARAGQPVNLVGRLLPLVGGYPGHAAAYVRSLVEEPDPAATPVPEAVRRAVGAELDRLDGPGRAVLMAGASLGARFTAATVERLLDWTPGRARPLLRTLVAAGVLVAHPGARYAVATPALRQVAADRLPRRLRAVFAQRLDVTGGPGRPTPQGTDAPDRPRHRPGRPSPAARRDGHAERASRRAGAGPGAGLVGVPAGVVRSGDADRESAGSTLRGRPAGEPAAGLTPSVGSLPVERGVRHVRPAPPPADRTRPQGEPAPLPAAPPPPLTALPLPSTDPAPPWTCPAAAVPAPATGAAPPSPDLARQSAGPVPLPAASGPLSAHARPAAAGPVPLPARPAAERDPQVPSRRATRPAGEDRPRGRAARGRLVAVPAGTAAGRRDPVLPERGGWSGPADPTGVALAATA